MLYEPTSNVAEVTKDYLTVDEVKQLLPIPPKKDTIVGENYRYLNEDIEYCLKKAKEYTEVFFKAEPK
jgi:hypothetical protein